MMNNYLVIMTTTPNIELAKKIAHELIHSHLCACVNILPKCHSIYKWQNEVCETEEFMLIIKSMQDKYLQIEEAIKKIHIYDVPEIMSFNLVDGSNEYLQWIQNSII